MKTTLVIPPFSDFYTTPARMAPLGAAVVRDILLDAGHSVILLDLPAASTAAPIPLPPGMAHLRPFLIPGEYGPTPFFPSFKRFGPTTAESADRILATDPDLILISLFAWCYAGDCVAVSRE